MESYMRFSQYELFLSLKRDLAMITQQVYVAEEWNKRIFNEAQAEAHTRSEVEKSLGSLKEDYSWLSEQLRDMTSQRDNIDAGLRTAEKLTEEFAKVCREYCDVTWDKALDASGVPSEADLRQPKSIFYHPDVRELTKAPEQPVVD
nr:hypothetical protein CFP56_13608 [Quercus suber]